MPEISRFFGIVIRMYYRDHMPLRNPVKSHTESGACRTLGGEESTGLKIVPQVFGMLRTALSFR